MALRLEGLKPLNGSGPASFGREGVSHRVWVILTQTLVRVLCGYPSRTRGWANSWYLSWYLRSDPCGLSERRWFRVFSQYSPSTLSRP